MREIGMLTPTDVGSRGRRGTRRAITVITVLASLMMVLSPAALAQATKTDVEFEAFIVFGIPEREWITNGGFHFRGNPYEGDLTGDLNGTISGETNGNIVFATGHATFFGTVLLVTEEGTWEGSFQGIAPPGEGAAGTFVAQGLDGTKLKGTFQQAGFESAEFTFEGVILDPHG